MQQIKIEQQPNKQTHFTDLEDATEMRPCVFKSFRDDFSETEAHLINAN